MQYQLHFPMPLFLFAILFVYPLFAAPGHKRKHAAADVDDDDDFFKWIGGYSDDLWKMIQLDNNGKTNNENAEFKYFNEIEESFSRRFDEIRPTKLPKYYVYLLIDTTKFGSNSNARQNNKAVTQASSSSPTNNNKITFSDFLSAILYIGKGSGQRVFQDCIDVYLKQNKNKNVEKHRRIEEIWRQEKGVIIMQPFANLPEQEAWRRKAAMTKTMGVDEGKTGKMNLTNIQQGKLNNNEEATKMEATKIGAILLWKSFQIYKFGRHRPITKDVIKQHVENSNAEIYRNDSGSDEN